MSEITLNRLVDALEAGDRPALQGVFTDDVSLRASLPRADAQRTGPAEAADLMLGWFTDRGDIKRLGFVLDALDRIGSVSYRFVVGGSLVIEQHAYCTFAGDRIGSIRLICSGFQPLSAPPAAVRLDALGETCATLTPRIAGAMRELRAGQTLTVVTDDPAAGEGIAAWCRMTGHEIVSVQLRHK